MLKQTLTLGLALSPLFAFASAKVDPALATFVRSESLRTQKVIVLLDAAAGPEVAPRRYDRVRLMSYLRQRATRASRQLETFLSREGALNRGVRIRQVFPSSLSALVEVTPAGLQVLARAPNVTKIYDNHKMGFEPPRNVRPVSRFTESEAVPYHFETSGLNKLIRDFPEYAGQGVVIGQVDTGVDGKHPALQGKVIAFYDGALGKRTDQPRDTGSHGTHTAGTMVGGSRTGENIIGVAPEAKLVAAAALGSWEEELKGMEFMLDPDSNPNTADQPRLVSNSWNSGSAPDQEPFYRAISTWEAAGILPVFSAGNSGPGAKTITPPHEHPEAFAVAATGEGQKIASFSSRGPGIFRGQETEKPDVAAPGVDVISAVPGGRYSKMSGTSMAAPHVAGAAALVIQANPDLNPAQIRMVLIKSSIPMNETGARMNRPKWNPVFGHGHLDMAAAVKLALDIKDGRSPFPRETNRFFVSPRSLEVEALRTDFPQRTIDDSWELVRQSADAPTAWMSLDALR